MWLQLDQDKDGKVTVAEVEAWCANPAVHNLIPRDVPER